MRRFDCDTIADAASLWLKRELLLLPRVALAVTENDRERGAAAVHRSAATNAVAIVIIFHPTYVSNVLSRCFAVYVLPLLRDLSL